MFLFKIKFIKYKNTIIISLNGIGTGHPTLICWSQYQGLLLPFFVKVHCNKVFDWFYRLPAIIGTVVVGIIVLLIVCICCCCCCPFCLLFKRRNRGSVHEREFQKLQYFFFFNFFSNKTNKQFEMCNQFYIHHIFGSKKDWCSKV